jgi:hypothetical protein
MKKTFGLMAFVAIAMLSHACGMEPGAADLEVGAGVYATGDDCPGCAKLSITNPSAPLGDVMRAADAAFSSWGTTTAVLKCDDGSNYDDASLGVVDLESGFSLEDVTPPDVDYESVNLTCILEVDDGVHNTNIGVLVELP